MGGCQSTPNTAKDGKSSASTVAGGPSTIERNRATAQKVLSLTKSETNIDGVVPEAFAEDVELLANGVSSKGLDAIKAFFNQLRHAFPDFVYDTQLELASANSETLVYESTWSGTHKGNLVTKLATYAATGKRVEKAEALTMMAFNEQGKVKKLSHFGSALQAMGLEIPGQPGATTLNKGGKSLNLGDVCPNVAVKTTKGDFTLHEYQGDDSWMILFSHPADFTPVCTTELSVVAKYKPMFDSRNCKLIAVSCDTVDHHNEWIPDIGAYNPETKVTTAETLPYPIIADENRELAFTLGMLDAVAKDTQGMPLTARAVFIFGPDHKLKLSILYPATTGRNFDEIIRVIDSLQLTAQRKLATPANWVAGGECVVVPSVSTAEAHELFKTKGVRIVDLPSKKEYLRFTPDPR